MLLGTGIERGDASVGSRVGTRSGVDIDSIRKESGVIVGAKKGVNTSGYRRK